MLLRTRKCIAYMSYCVTFACTAQPLNTVWCNTRARVHLSQWHSPTLEAIARLTAPRLRRWWKTKIAAIATSILPWCITDGHPRTSCGEYKVNAPSSGCYPRSSHVSQISVSIDLSQRASLHRMATRVCRLSLGESPNLDPYTRVTRVICPPLLRKKLPCFTML